MSTEKLYQTNNYDTSPSEYEPDFFDGDSSFAGSIGESDITFINSEPPQITFFDWLDDKLVENKGTSFFDWLHKLL